MFLFFQDTSEEKAGGGDDSNEAWNTANEGGDTEEEIAGGEEDNDNVWSNDATPELREEKEEEALSPEEVLADSIDTSDAPIDSAW